MKTCSWMRLWVSIVSIVGLLVLLGQVSGSAGEALSPEGEILVAQATPNDHPDMSAITTLTRSFLLFAGAYQLIDASGGACAGQCQVANPLTDACSCPSGYTAMPSARILADVTGGTCGSFQYICAK
jgi:hypothetical protein